MGTYWFIQRCLVTSRAEILKYHFCNKNEIVCVSLGDDILWVYADICTMYHSIG